MKLFSFSLLPVFFFLALLSSSVYADSIPETPKIAVGFQATSPVIGLGVKYLVAPNVDVKAAFGPFNTYTLAGIRLEVFQQRSNYNALCFVSYGSGTHDGDTGPDAPSSWHAFGLGVGVELFLAKRHEFGLSGDVGFLRYIHTDPNTRNYTTIIGGAGLFYYLK